MQISKVDLGAVVPAVLSAAVRSLGFTSGDVLTGRVIGYLGGEYITLRYADGSLSVSGARDVSTVTASVKRAYTSTLVTKQAARFGWRVKQGASGKLLLQKG